ncbi:MAG: DUF3857 and transglutaminase domain-containing protein [Acidobacteria bacterium]|nr:DUF3857 and transglutaminase domain-containing protein [Acidobacteriota bacterium]
MIRRILLTLAFTLCAANAFAWGGAPDWVKQLASQQLPTYPAETKGIALLHETVTTVTDDGEIRTLHRRVFRILNTEGKDLGVQSIAFDKERPIRSLKAWSITAKGEEYTIKDRDAVETAATDGMLYADNKIKVLTIPAADPGSTVALEYEQRERPYALQATFPFQLDVPVRVARYTLVLPAGWSHEERWFNSPAHEPQTPVPNQFLWELKDIAAIKDEVGAPTWRAVAGRMAINLIPSHDLQASKSHRSWNDVAKWYLDLAAPRRASTPGIAAKAQELTANKTTTLDKMRALALFAQRDVRYVAIEIGIGGYQPHAAGEIFTNRYGDCKDKATLLAALLHEIGVESYSVLATTNRGEIDRDFATLSGFNHAVLAIRLPKDVPADMPAVMKHPKLGTLLLFDPTDSTTPLGQLPTYLQENRLLIVADDGTGELVDVPAHPADATHLAITAKMALTQDGMLDGDVREVRTGFLASRARWELQTMSESERKQWLERRLGYHLSQFSAKDFAIENLDDVTKDLVLRYHVTAPSYAKRAAGMLLVRPRILGRKAEAVVDLKERTNAYVLDGPSLETDDIEIALPANLVADELPEGAAITSPAVSYTSAAKMDGNVLHYNREYKVSRFTVPLDGIPELNKVFTRILADERSSAVLKGK